MKTINTTNNPNEVGTILVYEDGTEIKAGRGRPAKTLNGYALVEIRTTVMAEVPKNEPEIIVVNVTEKSKVHTELWYGNKMIIAGRGRAAPVVDGISLSKVVRYVLGEVSDITPVEVEGTEKKTVLFYGDTQVVHIRGKYPRYHNGVALTRIEKHVPSLSVESDDDTGWTTSVPTEDLTGLNLTEAKDFSVGDEVVYAKKRGKVQLVRPGWISIRFRDGTQSDPSTVWNKILKVI